MAGVSDFIAKLSQLASRDVQRHILGKIRDVAHAECVRGFVEQKNPYGEPWAPRRPPTGTWPILQKTGKGLDSLTARVAGNRVVLRIRGYFRFHQGGTRYMVARQIFPTQSRGLGSWTQPIATAARDAVRELVERS